MATPATLELIALAKRLTPSGQIGDGMVARFHELADRADAEQSALLFREPITPLQAHIVASRAYEAAWYKEADLLCAVGSDERSRHARMHARAHSCAAEIMEAEAAKEEGGDG